MYKYNTILYNTGGTVGCHGIFKLPISRPNEIAGFTSHTIQGLPLTHATCQVPDFSVKKVHFPTAFKMLSVHLE